MEQLRVRQAMARIGDSTQIEFFCARLRSQDLDRVRDTLARIQYIARPELAEAVIPWLEYEDQTPSRTCGGPPPPSGLATLGLAAIYPDVDRPYGRKTDFWRARTRQAQRSSDAPNKMVHEAGKGSARELPPETQDPMTSNGKMRRSAPTGGAFETSNDGTSLWVALGVIGALIGLTLLAAATVRAWRTGR